jgi:hypothetical protein
MSWWVPIAVAIITGPVVVVLQRLRRENTEQHAESRGLLEHLVIKVDRMDDKLDAHMDDNHTHRSNHDVL